MLTKSQLTQIMPFGAKLASLFLAPLNEAMAEFEINTPERQAAFLAQVAHESTELTHMKENLNYSALALFSKFSKYFNSAEAAAYARQPERIANRIYANRMGNGDEASGDGWKFKGRGPIGITGADNYRACGTALGIDILSHPELLEQPLEACRSAGWYWMSRGLSVLADKGDFLAITKRINGGTNGRDEREAYYARAKLVLA